MIATTSTRSNHREHILRIAFKAFTRSFLFSFPLFPGSIYEYDRILGADETRAKEKKREKNKRNRERRENRCEPIVLLRPATNRSFPPPHSFQRLRPTRSRRAHVANKVPLLFQLLSTSD